MGDRSLARTQADVMDMWDNLSDGNKLRFSNFLLYLGMIIVRSFTDGRKNW